MKISIQYRNIAFIALIIHIVLFCLIIIANINFVHRSINTNEWLSGISFVTHIIPFIYLLALVKLATEKKGLFVAFYFDIFIVIAGAILDFSPFNFHSSLITNSIIGGLATINSIYFIVMAFQVKNQTLSTPFKIFACLDIFRMIIVFGGPIILGCFELIAYIGIAKYFSFANLFPFVGFAYIIYISARLFKQREADTEIV